MKRRALTERQKTKIRQAHADGATMSTLIKKYHRSFETLKAVVANDTPESKANKALAEANRRRPLETVLKRAIEIGRDAEPGVVTATINFRTGEVTLDEVNQRVLQLGGDHERR